MFNKTFPFGESHIICNYSRSNALKCIAESRLFAQTSSSTISRLWVLEPWVLHRGQVEVSGSELRCGAAPDLKRDINRPYRPPPSAPAFLNTERGKRFTWKWFAHRGDGTSSGTTGDVTLNYFYGTPGINGNLFSNHFLTSFFRIYVRVSEEWIKYYGL